jgi:Gluconate 2-dehydrogenase subunit 3
VITIQRAPLDAKPPLGGWRPGISFTDTQRAVLEAVADQLIPAGDGFPAPSEAGVLAFMARYIAPAGEPAKWYPFLEEADVKRRLDELGEGFRNAGDDGQIETLRGLERDEHEFFSRIRDLVYHAYYSRPLVVLAINKNLAAGRDLRVSPQPYGYSDTIIDWDDELLARVHGTYKRTEDVVRLELPSDLPRMTAAQARTTGFEAADVGASADEVRALESGRL